MGGGFSPIGGRRGGSSPVGGEEGRQSYGRGGKRGSALWEEVRRGFSPVGEWRGVSAL